MTNLSDTLAALSEADAVAAIEWARKVAASKPPRYTDASRNAARFILSVNAYRTGQLVPVPSVERVARVVADYQMSVGLPPDDAWEDADGIASAVIAAMKEGRE